MILEVFCRDSNSRMFVSGFQTENVRVGIPNRECFESGFQTGNVAYNGSPDKYYRGAVVRFCDVGIPNRLSSSILYLCCVLLLFFVARMTFVAHLATCCNVTAHVGGLDWIPSRNDFIVSVNH